MATVTPTVDPYADQGDGKTLTASWALVTANPDGRPIQVASFDELNWQGIAGTAGGATLAFEGSNDGGTTWFGLTKRGGTTAATLTASGGATTNELPLLVRPNLSAVGVGAIWTVQLTARKLAPKR